MKNKTAMMEWIDMLEADAKEYELDNVTIYSIINAYKKEAIKLLQKEKDQIMEAYNTTNTSTIVDKDGLTYLEYFASAEHYYRWKFKQD